MYLQLCDHTCTYYHTVTRLSVTVCDRQGVHELPVAVVLV